MRASTSPPVAATAPPPGLRYRPEVDGLRAVAVLPVILFHAGAPFFGGGYVGVDVFFVISGYLITSILIEEMSHDRFSIARFYERRARRILPALFFVLVCTSIGAWVWMVPEQFEEYSRALVAVVLFVSNVYFWQVEDYFAPAAELNPLLHTWSLAVEEQFYIFFPLLLLLLWRLGRGRAFRAILLLSFASLLLSEWGWRNKPTPNFFLLPTRAWELGLGAICAFVLRDAAPRGNALLAGLGLALIGMAVVGFDDLTPMPSLFTLAPVGGAALVIVYGRTGTLAARLLSMRLPVAIGLVSYSAYLWHQPLFALARVGSLTYPSPALMTVLALASLLLAWATWRWVEQPFRRRSGTGAIPVRSVVLASCAGAAVLVGIGAFGQATEGRRQMWAAANPDKVPIYDLHRSAMEIAGVYLDDGDCRFNVPAPDAETIARLRDCRARYGPGVAIFGDSHASDFFNGMDAAYDGDFVFGMTLGGCSMRADHGGACDFEGFAALLSDNPGLFRLVLYHQAGYRYFETVDGETGPEIFERIPETSPVHVENFRVHAAKIGEGLAYLGELDEHVPLVWVGPRIEPRIRLNYLLRGGCDHGYELREGQERLFHDLDHHLAGEAAEAGIAYVSLIDTMRLDMASDFMTCDELFWRDGDHWSSAGAERFVGRFLDRAPLERLTELSEPERARRLR